MKTYKRHVNLGPGIAWDQTFIIAKETYQNNDTLALVGFFIEEDGIEPDYETFTVNLPDSLAVGNRAYVDTNNQSHIDDWFVELGIATVIGVGASGFCTYPLLEFDKKWITELPTVDEVYETMKEVCYA